MLVIACACHVKTLLGKFISLFLNEKILISFYLGLCSGPLIRFVIISFHITVLCDSYRSILRIEPVHEMNELLNSVRMERYWTECRNFLT